MPPRNAISLSAHSIILLTPLPREPENHSCIRAPQTAHLSQSSPAIRSCAVPLLHRSSLSSSGRSSNVSPRALSTTSCRRLRSGPSMADDSQNTSSGNGLHTPAVAACCPHMVLKCFMIDFIASQMDDILPSTPAWEMPNRIAC